MFLLIVMLTEQILHKLKETNKKRVLFVWFQYLIMSHNIIKKYKQKLISLIHLRLHIL